MKPSLRDPLDGWWSPEHRAWLRAVDRGVTGEELDELDELAIAAGEQLRLEASRRLDVDLLGRAFVAARTPAELRDVDVESGRSASASTSPLLT